MGKINFILGFYFVLGRDYGICFSLLSILLVKILLFLDNYSEK